MRDRSRDKLEIDLLANNFSEGTIQALVEAAFYPVGGELVGHNYIGGVALHTN